jgi:hypothetical protein
MAQIKLRNSTGGTSKIGNQVKLVAGSKTAFIYANFYDAGIIGTVIEAVPNGNQALINLIGSSSSQNILVGSIAPTNPKAGDLWIDTSAT